jgi:hypothetical protein
VRRLLGLLLLFPAADRISGFAGVRCAFFAGQSRLQRIVFGNTAADRW